MKDLFIRFFTNDSKNKISSSKVLFFMISFAIANEFFNLVDKIKVLIGIQIFDKIINVSHIIFEYVFVVTIALLLLSLASLIIFAFVYKFCTNGKICSLSRIIVELLLRAVLDFGCWGVVLLAFNVVLITNIYQSLILFLLYSFIQLVLVQYLK